jgi:NDP-sugar pyrophosphorylase family protein
VVAGAHVVAGRQPQERRTKIRGPQVVAGAHVVIGAQVVMGALVVTGEHVVFGAQVVMGALVVTGEQVVIGAHVRNRRPQRLGAQVVVGAQVVMGEQVVIGALVVTGEHVVDAWPCPAKALLLSSAAKPTTAKTVMAAIMRCFMVSRPPRCKNKLDTQRVPEPN